MMKRCAFNFNEIKFVLLLTSRVITTGTGTVASETSHTPSLKM